MIVATATHPDWGSNVLCAVFAFFFIRTILRAMFGKYDKVVPREVRKGRPRGF